MPTSDDPTLNASQTLQQRVAEIGAKFLARCEHDLDDMDTLVARLRDGAPGISVALKQLAHRMNGAAAALGFPSLSTHAGSIEKLAATAAAGPVLPETVRAIELELSALRAALKSLQR